jgi:phosphoglycerate dehydrogenase-like enzyme
VELVRGLAGLIEPVGRALPGEAVPGRAQADVLWCPGSTRLSRAELEGAPRLRWIGDTSGGPPHLDYHYAARRGPAVTDCRRAFAPAVGEMALALYLAVLRDVVVHDRALLTPVGTEGAEKATHREASGRTIGLVGYGGIARALLGAEELDLIRPDAVLLVISRSHLVDEAALIERLRAGRFRAAMDVFDTEPLPAGHPYRSPPNVVMTPHRAGGTVESYRRIGRHLVNDLERFRRGEPPAENVLVTAEAARLQGRHSGA